MKQLLEDFEKSNAVGFTRSTSKVNVQEIVKKNVERNPKEIQEEFPKKQPKEYPKKLLNILKANC